MPFKSISKSQNGAFLSALRAGQYNLLLGAGASADSTNAFGALPIGDQFKDELCDLTGANRKHSLQRVYSLLSDDQIEKCVTKRFLNCKPGPTAKFLCNFLWRRIFTWNIDDVLENAYNIPYPKQELVSLHYNDEFRDADSLAQLTIVHLHGSVLTPDKGYVFSREQYVDQIQTVNPWMAVLSSYICSEPMIISGTSLDEVDLDHYLSFRTTLTAREDRAPSIFVTREDDAITASICRKHSLLHFKGYTSDFMEHCSEVLPNPPTHEELLPAEAQKLLPEGPERSAVMAFHSDFEIVPGIAAKSSNTMMSRFPYGHEPTWQDLASHLDIARPIVPEIVGKTEMLLRDDELPAMLLIIAQQAGSGKTTTLRRVAFELAGRGILTLMCSALSRIGRATSSLLDLIDDPVVIVVDNFADQATAISNILDQIERKDLVIIGAERLYRNSYLKSVLSDHFFETTDDPKLSANEVDNLIDKYFQIGGIGDHRILKNRREYFNKLSGDPIAIACCRILKNFQPLERIVEDLVGDADERDLDRFLCVAIARHCFMGGVRHSLLATTLNSSGLAAQFEPESILPLAYYGQGATYVVPENTTLSERVLSHVAAEDKPRLFRIFVALANGIAPFVNRRSIIRRAPEARLAGRLFDYDDVVQRLLGELSEQFYHDIKPTWQWNSRYWEQVALLYHSKYLADPESPESLSCLETAVQRARQAVAIEFHPFGLTTLGRVLMTQMLVPGMPADTIYSEAFERLIAAIDQELLRDRTAIHPFVALFWGTEKFVENGGILSDVQKDVLRNKIEFSIRKFPRDVEVQEFTARLNKLI